MIPSLPWVLSQNSLAVTWQGFAARVELDDSKLNSLAAVHVAGTKGKGSTCAMVEAILRAKGNKTGLYTSPHLLEARERIRINGVPISRPAFATHFWECWDLLVRHPNVDPTSPDMPTYFRFLTLLAFRVFAAEKVDIAVVEVGLGGRFDATNIIPRPVVCGVTALGFDHTAILGHTLAEIGYQKGGIIKEGVPVITSVQPEEGMGALAQCALDKGVFLGVAPPMQSYGPGEVIPAIKGEHQLENASLALQLCRAWVARTAGAVAAVDHEAGKVVPLGGFLLDDKERAAIQAVRWPGRSHKMEWGGLQIYLDGAHTAESCAACAGWFRDVSEVDASDKSAIRVLIFNCTGGRNPTELLTPFAELPKTVRIDAALFCPGAAPVAQDNPDQVNLTVEPEELLVSAMKVRGSLQACLCVLSAIQLFSFFLQNLECWEALQKGAADSTPALAFAYFDQCVEHIRKLQEEQQGVPVHVLVTGSLHLIGAFLKFTESEVI